MFKRLIIPSLLFVFLLLAAACGQTETVPEAEESADSGSAQAQTIGLLLPTDASFFTSIAAGAQETADLMSVTLLTDIAGDDVDTQLAQIDEMVAQGIDALIITPVDTTAVAPALAAAAEAGVVIITVDRSAETDVVSAHIASDNVAGGQMAGDFLAETIGDSGSVVELTGIAGTSAAQDRGAGFNQAISEYDAISIIARETGNFNKDEGEAVFSEILAANEEIDAVFAHNDDMILGAIAAAEAAGRDDIVFVGFDAIDAAISALEAGSLAATVAQQPTEMGRLGVETAVALLQGENVASFIPVDLALITR